MKKKTQKRESKRATLISRCLESDVACRAIPYLPPFRIMSLERSKMTLPWAFGSVPLSRRNLPICRYHESDPAWSGVPYSTTPPCNTRWVGRPAIEKHPTSIVHIGTVLNQQLYNFQMSWIRCCLDQVKLAKFLLNPTEEDRLIVALDQEKAYDRINHTNLLRLRVPKNYF
jgi:hypothetical protein